ncbi:MAG: hypothetical protein JWP25_334 [Bradyrhizobium sp.]|nr:hypothetical protein [Bradyrhizobium sp.]
MKSSAFVASAAALTLAFTSPARADETKTFIHLMVVTAGVVLHCGPNYEAINSGPRVWADASGVDFETIGPAVANALFANSGVDYDREKLIPAVTQVVRADMAELGGEITKLGERGFCRKYGRFPVENGLMTKK